MIHTKDGSRFLHFYILKNQITPMCPSPWSDGLLHFYPMKNIHTEDGYLHYKKKQKMAAARQLLFNFYIMYKKLMHPSRIP